MKNDTFVGAKRAEYWDLLKNTGVRVKRSLAEVGDLIHKFKSEVELMIPEIAAVPPDVQQR